MVQGTVSCMHGGKEIYFQVSRKHCGSGFLFHLRLPSLGRTLKKQRSVYISREQLPAPSGAGSLWEEGTKQGAAGARWSRPADINAGVKQRMEQHRGAVLMLWLEQCR